MKLGRTAKVLGASSLIGLAGCEALVLGGAHYAAQTDAAEIRARGERDAARIGSGKRQLHRPLWSGKPLRVYYDVNWSSGSRSRVVNGQLELYDKGLQFISESGDYWTSIPFKGIWRVDSKVHHIFLATNSLLTVHSSKKNRFGFDDSSLGGKLERYIEQKSGAR